MTITGILAQLLFIVAVPLVHYLAPAFGHWNLAPAALSINPLEVLVRTSRALDVGPVGGARRRSSLRLTRTSRVLHVWLMKSGVAWLGASSLSSNGLSVRGE